MDAEITIRYRLRHFPDIATCQAQGISFEQMVKDMIDEETLLKLADDPGGEIVSIRPVKSGAEVGV